MSEWDRQKLWSAARGREQDISNICGSFPAPVWVILLIKETDRHCPLASVQSALCLWKPHCDFSAKVSISLHPAVIHKVVFGQIESQAGVFADCSMVICTFHRVSSHPFHNTYTKWICDAFGCADVNCMFASVMTSASVNRVPALGLEGEQGLWWAQPHFAGEQEARQGPGEPVAQWVAATQQNACLHHTQQRLIHLNI